VVRRASLWLLCALAAACGDDGGGDGSPDAGATLPYATLAEYGFFQGTGATQQPVAGVIPFDVNAPLFADFTGKQRFFRLPPGGKITYHADGTWIFPTGTMVIKSFGVGTRLIETRVFIKQDGGWTPTTYLWNEQQTEATLLLVGARVPITVQNEQGQDVAIEYRVPNTNQCYGCHGTPGETDMLGLRTRQMNRDGQIEQLVAMGAFDGPLPPPSEWGKLPDPYAAGGDLDAKARAWLEANCAHCHSPGGAAGGTRLWLNVDVTTPIDYGICRIPNAAGAGAGGRRFDIVPGAPDESVMTFRIASTVPGIKMPEMPVQLVDQRGVDLITAWIAAMPATGCGN
jgi:uncharacterized repeat protein (TIGR03806 family)